MAGENMFALGRRLGTLDVVVCCGSGGVGKTTVSAALALSIAASHDRKVLVLTVDPARRLATALGVSIGADPVLLPRARLRRAGIPQQGEVWAAMLDMKLAWDRLIERAAPDRRTAQRILRNRFYERISDSFVGSHEYAAMETLYELHEAGEYDCIVVDTPPSRNALDFLDAPSRLSDYVGARLLSWLAGPSGFGLRAVNFAATPFLRIADRLLGGEVLQEVSDFVRQLQQLYGGVQQRARDVYRLLRSPRVGFVVVSTLEPGPFKEAEFFAGKLRDYAMPLRSVVVNRVLPDSLSSREAAAAATTLVDDASVVGWLRRHLDLHVTPETVRSTGRTFLTFNALAQRDEAQLQRLSRFSQAPVTRIPLFTDDLSQLEGLARIAALL
ncbi:MAG: ArsA family ATPase [Candidatus Dormibacteraeota bacterium]|nr:ArsA family ATPase [Candidatus Dormibacteraeota bacterium]